ncbi:hypothetical protein [Peredibacter starrii]|uniref:Uncharacterized protein n=1 Tax=Peredibacter starrii TaxID=28202 RepID=A0AAX4HQ44_9BACT|nr:hypothetical protein [Peredibacter starrii]WPU65342.1 hypothetical protein SOO65_01115 [Peredibacter starrii]
MLKFIALALTALSLSSAFADVGAPTAEKYRAKFTNFSCKSFRDKAPAPERLTDLNLKFGHLGVDRDLNFAIVNLVSTDDKGCEYRARFERIRATREIKFLESQMIGGEECQALKLEVDPTFEAGFMYISKYDYYFALRFNDKFANACESTTGNFMAEFELGL